MKLYAVLFFLLMALPLSAMEDIQRSVTPAPIDQVAVEIVETQEIATSPIKPPMTALTPAPMPDFMHYYNSENKELNLNNLPITNESLAHLEPQLRDFINVIGVERLLLERTALRQIPYTLIGFALVSKSLKYVSFLGNNFNLIATDVLHNSGDAEELRPRTDSLVASTITSVWGNLSPEIERILEEHNSNGSKFHVYNKIIFIDRTMPPITILNSERKPYSTYERVKYITIRVGLFGLGVLVTLLPSIIPWILTEVHEKGSE